MELTVQKDTYTREECMALRTLRDVLEDTLKGAQEALQAVHGSAAAELAACMPVPPACIARYTATHGAYSVQHTAYSMQHTPYSVQCTAQARLVPSTTVLDDNCCTLRQFSCLLLCHVVTRGSLPHCCRLRRVWTSTRAWGQSTTHWCSTTQRSWYAPAPMQQGQPCFS